MMISVSTGRSTSTPITSHYGLPALSCAKDHFPEKLAFKYSASKYSALFSVDSIAQDGRLKCVLLDCWTQQSQGRLNQAINQLPKTDNGCQGEGCPCWFRLDQFWSLLLLSSHVWIKNWAKSMHFCQIQHNFSCSEYLCKLDKEYLNALTCKFPTFSRQNSATFDISHAFLPLTTAKLSTPKNGQFFGPLRILNATLSRMIWLRQ